MLRSWREENFIFNSSIFQKITPWFKRCDFLFITVLLLLNSQVASFGNCNIHLDQKLKPDHQDYLSFALFMSTFDENYCDEVDKVQWRIEQDMMAIMSTLSLSDIAFTGYRSDDEDEFAFILLKEIISGTVIRFTDRGWEYASNGFVSNGEGTITVTFSSNYGCGDEFLVRDAGAWEILESDEATS